LLKAFNQAKKNYLIIDFNPETISKLSQKGINCIYGDVNDVEFLSSIKLNKAKIVVSTIPDSEINLKVIDHIKNKNIVFIPTSHNIKESMNLYKAGADYVIMPHFLGGDFMAHLLVKDNFKKKLIKLEGKKQIKELKHRLSEGHKHPETS
jgi:voltage-gated potassium channel Kch